MKKETERELELAGPLHEACMHIGRYLEKDPPEWLAIWAKMVRKALGEIIRFHEELARSDGQAERVE